MPDDEIVNLDPNEVEVVSLPPAMKPMASHAAAAVRAGVKPRKRQHEITPLSEGRVGQTLSDLMTYNPAEGGVTLSELTGSDNALVSGLDALSQGTHDFITGGAKKVGQFGYNLGHGAITHDPTGIVRGASEDWWGKEHVKNAFGLDDEADIIVPPSSQKADPLTGAVTPTADEAALMKRAEEQRVRREGAPEFGAMTDVLTPQGKAQHAGAITTELAAALALNPEMELPAGLTALIEKGATGGMVARTAARAPEALKQAVIGGVLGQATTRDPLAGTVFGGITGGLMGGRSQAALDAAADRMVGKAKVRLGRAIAPTMKGNKKFVEANAEQIIREVDWFGTGGLQGLQESAAAKATSAGEKIDQVMANHRQADVSGLLKSARTDLQTTAQQMLLKDKQGVVELAPQTREALEHAVELLTPGKGRINPMNTNLSTLRQAHEVVNDAVYEMRREVQRRVRQTRLGWAGTVMDKAIAAGVPQQARQGARLGRAGIEDVIGAVEGTRTSTKPIIAALEKAKEGFGSYNAAGRFVADVPEAVAHIDNMISNVASYGDEISADTLRSMRQNWDSVVAGADGKGWLGTSIADESRRGTTKIGANIAREELGNLVPEVKPHNADFTFQSNLRDAIADTLTRRTGQTGGLMKSLSVLGSALGVGGFAAGSTAAMATGGTSLVFTALIPAFTKIVKSPEFNLLSAKTRLAIADAVRSGSAEKLWGAAQRLTLEAKLHEQAAGGHPASGGADLTDEEYQHELQKLIGGQGLTPGITDRANPDSAYADAPGYDEDRPGAPEMPEPGILPGSSDADDPMPGDPDYQPGIDGPAVDDAPAEVARGETSLGPRDPGRTHNAEQVYQASMVPGEGLLKRGLQWAQTPLLEGPDIEGHPTISRALKLGAQFTSPLDLAFLGEEAARPLLAGTRAARGAEAVGRGVSGTMALAGAQNLEEGIKSGSPSQVVGGGTQLLFGGLGARSRGLAGAAEEVGSVASRVGTGLRRAGTQAVVGPAIALGSSAIADSPAMRRMIPDDDRRNAVVTGLQVMGMGALGAAAYRNMTPTMKATTHAAGQLSIGRAESIVRHEIRPALEADVRAKYPGWADEKVAAKVTTLEDAAITKARSALEEVHAESGGRATDPRTYEQNVRPDLRHFGDWYRGAKDMVKEMIPAAEGEAVNADGLTTKQALGVDSLATFGTNTPPKQNYELFAEAADQINGAPAHLSREELLQWTKENRMPGGNLFGMDPDKPGVPALRNIVTGKEEGFGGRKIESYGINLAEGTRPDITGKEVIPATVDRWIYRAAGLPTEVPERTGEPVYRTNPKTGQPLLDPQTGEPMQRGGSRTKQKVVALGTNEERYASETERLMAQATQRAEARGTPITQREIDAIDTLARRNAQQHEVPVQKQAGRSTAVGSRWLGQSTPGNVSYEVIEQGLKRAGQLQGLDVDQAQAMTWYKAKLQSNLSHAEAPEQGLPFPQQRKLAQTQARELATEVAALPADAPWSERTAQARKIIEARNAALAKTLGANATGPDSGFSRVIKTNTDPGGSPVSAVSIYPERQVIVPRGVRAVQGDYNSALASFIRDNADLLDDPNLGVGGWVVKAPTAAERRAGKKPMQFGGREVPEGTLVLDVVALPSNKANNAIAKSLGMEYLQDSIFDLEKFENVKTGGQSYGRRSPAAIRAQQERRPGVYERGGELTPEKVPERLRGLREGGGLSDQQSKMLDQWDGTPVVAIGGDAAAAASRVNEVTTVVGRDRYETARLVAEHFFVTPPFIGVASGETFADALSGGAQAAANGGPLLLTPRAVLHADARSFLATRASFLERAVLYGGTAALSTDVESAVHAAVG